MKLRHFYHHHHRELLDEETYKDLINLIDPNFDFFGSMRSIPHSVRARMIPRVMFQGFHDIFGNDHSDTMLFEVPSPHMHRYWNNWVRFVEWQEVAGDSSMKATERARLLLWEGNIQVHCDCPAYLWWGFQYMLTQIDSALVPINIPPNIRNPHRRGIVCKHLDRTLHVLGFHSGDLAKEIKAQFG